MANYNISSNYTGLATITLPAAPTADPYTIQGTLVLPSVSKGSSANSSVVVVVNKNGSAIYTGVAGAMGFKVVATLAAGDIITIVPSSSNTVDQGKQTVKITVQMWEGVT